MPLPEPASRRPLHRRVIEMQGYARDDGLWDLEARLTDHKLHAYVDSHGRPHPAGTLVHDLSLRLTLDDERQVHGVFACMDRVPYASCPDAQASLQELKGARIGPGWRKVVRERLDPRLSCTHLGELVVTMATLAYQAQAFGRGDDEGNPWPALRASTMPPHVIGQCLSWQADSEVVREVFPLLHRPRARAGQEQESIDKS